ncbi:fam11a b protein [Anaeramoeba ignava]|uniref:Fam11a b protein n=1 Tax=Anaeramoeba ignava TaxID=1746090 RepID=A0A9Q0L9N6_ANAIG|nr:fam11a b protein [Anaeramoeba ignava]
MIKSESTTSSEYIKSHQSSRSNSDFLELHELNPFRLEEMGKLKINEEIEENEKEKVEKTEDLNKYFVYQGKGVYCLDDNDIVNLFQSEKLLPSDSSTVTYQEPSFVISVLPAEIWLLIFEYLKVPEVIKISMVCRDFQDLTYDRELWRRLAIKINEVFIWNKLSVAEQRLEEYKVIGYQLNIENEIISLRKIQEEKTEQEINEQEKENLQKNLRSARMLQKTNISEDRIHQLYQSTPHLLSDNPPQRNHPILSNIRLLRKKEVADQETTKRDENDELVPVAITNENTRMQYINLLENPRESLIEKFIAMKNQYDEKREFQARREQELRAQEKTLRRRDTTSFLFGIFVCLWHFSLLIFLILLNCRIEKIISIDYSIMFIPMFITLSISAFFLFMLSFYVYSVHDSFSIRLFASVSEVLNVQFLLIALKQDDKITANWPTIFFPFFLLAAFFVIFIFCVCIYESSHPASLFLPMLTSLMFMLFIIFLVLKLNRNIYWNWASVFSPLFVIYLLPCFGCCCACLSPEGWALQAISGAVFIILLPLGIFQILLALYLEGNDNVSSISYVFIPLYILNGFIFFFTGPSCFVLTCQFFFLHHDMC